MGRQIWNFILNMLTLKCLQNIKVQMIFKKQGKWGSLEVSSKGYIY